MHVMFSRTGHALGHKTNLSKFKRTEIISTIFSDHNRMKLEIDYWENGKNTQRLNNMLLKKNPSGSMNKSKKKFLKYPEICENGNTMIQNLLLLLFSH